MHDDNILKILLTIFSAFLGYLFREYQNRVQPYYRILGIDGGVGNNTIECEIPDETHSWFSNSKIFRTLDKNSLLNDLRNSRKTVRLLKKSKDEIEQLVNLIIEKIDSQDSSYTDELSELLSIKVFYQILRKFLYEKNISYKKKVVEVDESKRMKFVMNKDDDGEVIIEFPNKRVKFGSDFKTYEYIFEILEPFLKAIVNYDESFIKEVLKDFLDIFSTGFTEIDMHDRNIVQIIDSTSQWGFHFFIANNSNKPFIVGKKGKLFVKDTKTRAMFEEDIYVAIIDLDKKGKAEQIWDLPSDHVIKPGESFHLLLLTTNVQSRMTNGLAIRNTYSNETGVARLSLPLYRVGLSTKAKLNTSLFPFNNTTGINIW